MKTMSTLVCAILFSSVAIAQNPDPSVLASAGGISSNAKMTLEWTLGEASVSTGSQGKNIFTEGFHQPIILISNNRRPEIVRAIIRDLSITIAPNPVMSILTVRFAGKIESKLTLSLLNSSGKLLIQTEYMAKTKFSTIAMEHLPGGVYFLQINDATGLIKSFEIIKL